MTVDIPRLPKPKAWPELTLQAAVTVTDLALKLGVQPEFFADKLAQRVGAALKETETDSETLAHLLWFGSHLKAFLHRLVRERPAAARAILRFMGTYAWDVRRRTEEQRNGLPSPSTVVIEPTDRCNLNCPGCYANSRASGSDLPFERLVEIVQQVVEMGVSLITLSGGEPFLRERTDRTITRLAAHFPERGFLVYTNGTLIDEPVAERLREVGNVFVAISVEGYESQTDARRGAGIYERNRRARRLLVEKGVLTGFSATVTRANAELIASDEFIDRRIEEGDLFGWFFLLQPIGRAPRPDLMPTARQRARLREAIIRWRESGRPIFLGDFWNDGPLVGGCIAGGRYYFHIYANGDISPCVFAPVSCGNIFDIVAGKSPYSGLRDFVERHPVFAAIRREQKAIHDRRRPCLLIDHPEVGRRICRMEGCRPAKNMPPGYLDGPIARAIDELAEQWRETAPRLPPMVKPNEHASNKFPPADAPGSGSGALPIQ